MHTPARNTANSFISIITTLIILLITLITTPTSATTYNYYPNSTNFANDLLSKSLKGGDIVYFHASNPGGSYTYDIGITSTFTWFGDKINPIIVRNYPGDKIIFTNTNSNADVIRLAGQYWLFEGFEIVGNAAAQGSIGLRLQNSTNDVVLQNLVVHDLYENAITANFGGAIYNNITMRYIEIYNTGGTGECIYCGSLVNNSYWTGLIKNSLFEYIYCHDTCFGPGSNGNCNGGSYGTGIQIKLGSFNNTIRNCVFNNTNNPSIFLYDDAGQGPNYVEGNLVLNCRSDAGIQVSAGAVFVNNIVIGSARSGIFITANSAQVYQGGVNKNLKFYHNSLILNGRYGIEFAASPITTEVINNLCLGSSIQDLNAANQTGNLWKRNAYYSGNPPPGVSINGTFQVGTLVSQVTSASSYNVYPLSTSQLIRAGYPFSVGYDFNYKTRDACAPTVGAYEFAGNTGNPWVPVVGIKSVVGTVAPCTLASPCPATCATATTGITATTTGTITGTTTASSAGTTGSTTGTTGTTASSTGTSGSTTVTTTVDSTTGTTTVDSSTGTTGTTTGTAPEPTQIPTPTATSSTIYCSFTVLLLLALLI